MKAASRIEPSRSLYQGMQYTPAAQTDLRRKWADFFAEHTKPLDAESYQRDQIAERGARQIPGNY